MNRIKKYFINQAKRPAGDLVFDLFLVGGFFACVYIGFIAAQ